MGVKKQAADITMNTKLGPGISSASCASFKVIRPLVLGSPVSGLQKDRKKTGPRPEKTGPAVLVFCF